MKYIDFKKKIENGEEFSTILIDGEDAFFRERALELIKKKFLVEPDLNLAVFNGEDMDFNRFVSSLFQYPFMSEKRITLVRDFSIRADQIKGQFKEYLENPPKESILIILNEKPTDCFKKFNICHVECQKAEISMIIKWIKSRCERENVSIEYETATLLAQYCLLDMSRIENETEKLICYCLDKKQITKDDLEQTVYKDSEYKIYEMTEYVAKKKFDSAMNVITELTSKGETPIRILNSVYNYFRRLLLFAISDKSDAELASAFSIKEYAVTKTKEQAGKFKKINLKRAVDYLTEADYKIKSGRVDQENQMWMAVFELMTEK